MYYRQGDILLVPGDAPEGAVKVKPVLALGEATGHSHTAVGATCYADAPAKLAEWVVVPEGGATVVHQEHAPITLAPGSYQVIRQVEHWPEGLRQVAD